MKCPHCKTELTRDQVARMPLRFAPLPGRVKNALGKGLAEYYHLLDATLGDVAKHATNAMGVVDVHTWPGLGEVSREQLREFLESVGLLPACVRACEWHEGKPRKKKRTPDEREPDAYTRD